jgi:hypothetical protein
MKAEVLDPGFKEMGVADGSKTLDIGLPRLELVIQNAGNADESNMELIKLQQELVALTTKYELLR